MHAVIRRRLEDLLDPHRHAPVGPDVTAHLEECSECLAELESMKAEAGLLTVLRAPEGLEPQAGFYARVMQRIEEQGRRESVWAALLRSPFSSRLAYASLALTIVLGSYVVASESRDGHLRSPRVVTQMAHVDPPVVGTIDQQRDAVLANFAEH